MVSSCKASAMGSSRPAAQNRTFVARQCGAGETRANACVQRRRFAPCSWLSVLAHTATQTQARLSEESGAGDGNRTHTGVASGSGKQAV
jgi:hypothetical protein